MINTDFTTVKILSFHSFIIKICLWNDMPFKQEYFYVLLGKNIECWSKEHFSSVPQAIDTAKSQVITFNKIIDVVQLFEKTKNNNEKF